jgi:hypothetical protein
VKLPRVSIAGLMGAVMVAALDCSVMRWLSSADSPYDADASLGILPMASLLVIGLLLMIRELWRRGECRPFLAGFEAFGAAAVTLYLAWYALAPESLGNCVEVVLSFLDAEAPEWAYLSGLTVTLSGPELLIASAGGWLTSRLGIVVARRGPAAARQAAPATTG